MTLRPWDPKDLWVSRSSGASLSKGTLAPLSCVITAGKVWEGENLRFGICFSEKPFNCQWQKTWCKQTRAKRELALLSRKSSGGPAFHGVWSELRWCHKAWVLCGLVWFSYASGPYFLTLWWQERGSNSISSVPATCPMGNTACFSPRPPGEDAPYLTGCRYFPLIWNISGHGVAATSMVLLGPDGLPTMRRLIQADEQPPAAEEEGPELAHTVNLKLLLRCGMPRPLIFSWPKIFTWLKQYHRG